MKNNGQPALTPEYGTAPRVAGRPCPDDGQQS